ncbi:MAG: flavodoxin domain-containing protein [Tannerellaceae bacterium]|nr:flavodoxin domain-containing protein [Tannerellaceae bacterium]
MRIAIVFVSRHGTTEKVAKLLANKFIHDSVTLISLHKEKDPDLSSYDCIILGTSIYAGKPISRMSKFCASKTELLCSKKVGTFICCMEKVPEKRQEQLENAFPKDISRQATARGIFGGEFLYEKMFVLSRILVKSMTKVKNSVSEIDYEAIDEFSRKMAVA